jgi:L-lactate dehydrogenase complex protein LldF
MHIENANFVKSSDTALQDHNLRRRLSVLAGFVGRRDAAFGELKDGEALRDRARAIKEHTIANLDKYLIELESSIERLGGTVHWALDGNQACRIILDIARSASVKRVVKSKSMVSEEIGLNEELERAGIEAVETDLGEYIVQLAREKPSHILAPAIHKSKMDVSELFSEKLGAAGLTRAEDMAQVARSHLREKFCTAEMGITGVNFAAADTGTILLVENEGNIRLSTSLPRLHVAVMGIEKVIPRFEDLAVFLKILPRSATGQKMSSYVSFITGPRRDGEADGAEEFHLIILDNGRTRILQDESTRESLYCIRCGACLNVCPVYRKIGGHAYGAVYSGPIGSIITPPMVGLTPSRDLPFASSLCGACKEICPVRIDIPHILLSLRRQIVEADRSAGKALWERIAIKLWTYVMKHPRLYRLFHRLASHFQGPLLVDGKFERLPFILGGWTENRDFPQLARKSFRDIWTDIKGD